MGGKKHTQSLSVDGTQCQIPLSSQGVISILLICTSELKYTDWEIKDKHFPPFAGSLLNSYLF